MPHLTLGNQRNHRLSPYFQYKKPKLTQVPLISGGSTCSNVRHSVVKLQLITTINYQSDPNWVYVDWGC